MTEKLDYEECGLISFSSFFITLRRVIFRPTAAFAGLVQERSTLNSIFFLVIGGVIGSLSSGLWQYYLHRSSLSQSSTEMLVYTSSIKGLTALMFMTPLILICCVFVVAGVAHLFLRFTGKTKPFQVTLKVFAYSWGATSPMNAVPIFGTFAAIVWGLVCIVKGLSVAHDSAQGRAFLAITAPVVLLVGIMLLFVVVLAGFGLFTFINGSPFLNNLF